MFPELPKDLLDAVKGEKIIWYGRPLFWPFILRGVFIIPFIIPFIVFPLFIPGIFSASTLPFILFFFMFWYGITLTILGAFTLYPILLWRNVFYVLTENRIIVRRGVIGIDYDFLKLELVQQIEVNVGVIDKIYGTGSIIIMSVGVKPIIIANVRNPLEVRNIIERQVEAVKGRL